MQEAEEQLSTLQSVLCMQRQQQQVESAKIAKDTADMQATMRAAQEDHSQLQSKMTDQLSVRICRHRVQEAEEQLSGLQCALLMQRQQQQMESARVAKDTADLQAIMTATKEDHSQLQSKMTDQRWVVALKLHSTCKR